MRDFRFLFIILILTLGVFFPQSSLALETVVIDFETKPDGTPIIGGTLVQGEPNALITDVDLDGEPHYLIYESLGVRFGSNDIIYGSPGVFSVPLSLFNLMVGNTGEPSEGLGQASIDDIDIFFIHPVTKQPRTVHSVEMLVIDPELPLTVTAFDLGGTPIDIFSNPCLNCSFTALVSSPLGIAHVVVSIAGDSTFGIDDLEITQDPIPPATVGGTGIPIDKTALLLANPQLITWWVIPVLAGIGIGVFVIKKRS